MVAPTVDSDEHDGNSCNGAAADARREVAVDEEEDAARTLLSNSLPSAPLAPASAPPPPFPIPSLNPNWNDELELEPPVGVGWPE